MRWCGLDCLAQDTDWSCEFVSWARPIQSTLPHPASTRSNHLRLGLPSGLLPSGFSTYTRSSSPPFVLHAPAHLILLALIQSTESIISCFVCLGLSDVISSGSPRIGTPYPSASVCSETLSPLVALQVERHKSQCRQEEETAGGTQPLDPCLSIYVISCRRKASTDTICKQLVWRSRSRTVKLKLLL
jgi:hypothetical protein